MNLCASPTTTRPAKSMFGRDAPSATVIKTFQRLRLYKVLRLPMLLRSIMIDGGSLHYDIVSWEEYWDDVPVSFRRHIEDLNKSWKTYISSGFTTAHGKSFSHFYLQLIRAAVVAEDMWTPANQKFIGRILGFENFVIGFRSGPFAFAAATASFRSPLFLSFAGIRKHNRNDPSLLPLLVGLDGEVPGLYYHYRKHRLLKNTDENLLLFPAVDTEKRPSSFGGLQFLAGNMLSEWDSRIEQRSRLLANKVLVPLLSRTLNQQKALRILDVGSGVGLFTSRVIARIVNSGILEGRKIELSLVDILSTDPQKHFALPSILASISKTEYISSDYAEWLSGNSTEIGKFNLVFLFRILHNLSKFCIRSVSSDAEPTICRRSRYTIFPHLSDYYCAISRLFPKNGECPNDRKTESQIFYPSRQFDPSSLLTIDEGRSVIRRLAEMSSGILIEDGDLSPEILVEHLSQHKCERIRAYDLSQRLRLSINHIYWITQSGEENAINGKLIWPK